jgi:hypothetical protein
VAEPDRVPLAPATFPEQDTTIHVAPGPIAITCPYRDRFRLSVANPRSAVLDALRDPGFPWPAFTA